MTLLSPWWIAGLFPWLGLAIWLFWGRRRRIDVPFLELWRSAAERTHARRRMRVPPAPIVLALASLLLTIVACGSPALRRDRFAGLLTIIVDRGIAMSAEDGGQPRFSKISQAVEASLKLNAPRAQIELITLPGDGVSHSVSKDWSNIVASMPTTALNTTDALRSVIARRLSEGDGPIIVISDQHVSVSDDRLIQAAAEGVPQDVGIAAMAVRSMPRPQAMIQVLNQSKRNEVALIVRSGNQKVNRRIDLPPRGSTRNYFVDLDQMEEVVEASLDARDDLSADDRAWLVRQQLWPRIAIEGTANSYLSRMVEVYARHHPASANSPVVHLYDGGGVGPTDELAVYVAPPSNGGESVPARTTVRDHSITRNVQWVKNANRFHASGSPPAGFATIVESDHHPLVAVRSEPPRQVWVGMDGRDWAGSADFVIFWTNVLDWVGQGNDFYAASPVNELDDDWTPLSRPARQENRATSLPGVYRKEGVVRAFNAPAPIFDPPPATHWQAAIAALPRRGQKSTISPFLILVSLSCLIGAAAGWRENRRSQSLPGDQEMTAQRSQAVFSR